MPLDPKTLPQDADTLRKIVVDLIEQLDRSLAEQTSIRICCASCWKRSAAAGASS
jgi:hypothetical protein